MGNLVKRNGHRPVHRMPVQTYSRKSPIALLRINLFRIRREEPRGKEAAQIGLHRQDGRRKPRVLKAVAWRPKRQRTHVITQDSAKIRSLTTESINASEWQRCNPSCRW